MPHTQFATPAPPVGEGELPSVPGVAASPLPIPIARRLARGVGRWSGPAVAVAASVAAVLALRGLLADHTPAEIAAGIAATPGRALALAGALTLVSYLVMAGYDALGLRYVGERAAPHRVLWASWVGTSASLVSGFPLLTAAPLRFRMYGAWGIGAEPVARLVGFVFLTFAVGLAAAAAVVIPLSGLRLPGLPGGIPDLAAAAPLAALPVLLFLGWSWRARGPIRVLRWSIPAPPPRIAAAQVALSAVDWVIAGTVLYALLPAHAGVGFWTVIAAFLLAQVAAILSQVPGGLGVLETVLVFALGRHLPADQVLGAVVAYRAVYIVGPFALAVLLYAAFELAQRAAVLRLVGRVARHASCAATPHLLGLAAYGAGALVLLASLRPASHELAWARDLAPLPLPEFSRLLGAAVGVVLLLVARGLQRRVHGAYRLTLLALAVAGALLLARGRLPEALPLALLLAALLPMHREFYRRSGLWSTARRPATLPAESELAVAAAIADRADTAVAQLAQLGDKAILLDDEHEAYLMYAVEGSSWVALGDGVGPEPARRELIWSFRDRCDAAGAMPVFYQVRPESLPIFLEMGYALIKLGEEARVPVQEFSLEGSSRSNLRRIHRRFQKDGYAVRALEPLELEARLPELRRVSDFWLADKGQGEKGFSLGFFDEDYLRRSTVLVAEREGAIHAFVSLLATRESRAELLSDLMRYDPACPWGVMDFLLMGSLEWAGGAGYRWLNLGMAPLSGIEGRRRSPFWSHFAATLFEHGGDFYGFQGIRRFKEKYDPVWTPKYLACPSSLAAPRALANVTALVSGRLRVTPWSRAA